MIQRKRSFTNQQTIPIALHLDGHLLMLVTINGMISVHTDCKNCIDVINRHCYIERDLALLYNQLEYDRYNDEISTIYSPRGNSGMC